MTDEPTPGVDLDTSWRELDRAAGRLAEATDAATLRTPVPTCPGWDLHRLVEHTGRVHRWVVARLTDPDDAPGRSWDLDVTVPGDVGVATWLTDGAATLVEVLRSQDPDELVSTWAGTVPARFWTRRMLHETVVHAWDGAHAVGDAPFGARAPVPLPVAVDTTDEVLEVVWPNRLDRAGLDLTTPGPTIHLHATDDGLAQGAGEWLVEIGDTGITTRREHAKGDVAVRGPAWSLALAILGRVPPDQRDDAGLTAFGDHDLLDRVAGSSRF